jgi:hypothetical protein
MLNTFRSINISHNPNRYYIHVNLSLKNEMKTLGEIKNRQSRDRGNIACQQNLKNKIKLTTSATRASPKTVVEV